ASRQAINLLRHPVRSDAASAVELVAWSAARVRSWATSSGYFIAHILPARCVQNRRHAPMRAETTERSVRHRFVYPLQLVTQGACQDRPHPSCRSVPMESEHRAGARRIDRLRLATRRRLLRLDLPRDNLESGISFHGADAEDCILMSHGVLVGDPAIVENVN